MKDVVLVTGGSGFVGRALMARLLSEGVRVVGTFLGPKGARVEELCAKGAEFFPLDLRDSNAVDSLVEAIKPTVCFHLAARAHVPSANADPGATLDTNLMGTAKLSSAFGRHGGKLFVFASTIRVYGSPRFPIVDESHPLDPQGAYAVSKLAAESLIAAASKTHGFRSVLFRLFNHTGPEQAAGYVVADFASRLARAKVAQAAGREEKVYVGNLDVRRDFSDVEDIVEAYLAALHAPEAEGIYNVGRGESVSIREILEGLAAAMQISPQIQVDPRFVRIDDPQKIQADISKFQKVSGWAPKVPWSQTLQAIASAALQEV